MKRCSRCHAEKPLPAFGKNIRNGDGLQYQCRECRAVMEQEYRLRLRGRMPESPDLHATLRILKREEARLNGALLAVITAKRKVKELLSDCAEKNGLVSAGPPSSPAGADTLSEEVAQS